MGVNIFGPIQDCHPCLVEVLQDAAVDTADRPHALEAGDAGGERGDTVAGQAGVGVPEGLPPRGGHQLSPHDVGGDGPLEGEHQHHHGHVEQ